MNPRNPRNPQTPVPAAPTSRWQQVRANPALKRKLGLMALLLLVGLLLWGRLLMKQVPRTATAAGTSQAKATKPAPSDNEPALVIRPAVEVNLPDRITRDIFSLNPNWYERTASNQPDLPVQVTPTRRPAENEKELTLESTITGTRPYAVINGEVMAVGQTIQGYELVAVENRAAVLKRDDLLLRLEMKTP